MRALWLCIGIMVLNMVPASAHDDDFSTHNRFNFAKHYWSQESEHMPVAHDPDHSVKSGQVHVAPSPLADLLRPASQPATATVSFGQPRTTDMSPTRPFGVARKGETPKNEQSAFHPPSHTSIPLQPQRAVAQVVSPPAIRESRRVSALLVATPPKPSLAQAYPENLGYIPATAYVSPHDAEQHELKVKAKLLRGTSQAAILHPRPATHE